jgi:hypothetical protein
MASGKPGLNSGKRNKKGGVFTRLINWIAEGAAKAQKGGGQCTT